MQDAYHTCVATRCSELSMWSFPASSAFDWLPM